VGSLYLGAGITHYSIHFELEYT